MAFFISRRQAQFADSDAAGVIHFSRIAVYVEEAEHLFLQQQGYPIDLVSPEAFHWPRIKYSASYMRPIQPFESIKIELAPRRVGTSSITWRWLILKAEDDQEVAQGEMKTICCKLQDGSMKTHPLPEDLRRNLTSGM